MVYTSIRKLNIFQKGAKNSSRIFCSETILTVVYELILQIVQYIWDNDLFQYFAYMNPYLEETYIKQPFI